MPQSWRRACQSGYRSHDQHSLRRSCSCCHCSMVSSGAMAVSTDQIAFGNFAFDPLQRSLTDEGRDRCVTQPSAAVPVVKLHDVPGETGITIRAWARADLANKGSASGRSSPLGFGQFNSSLRGGRVCCSPFVPALGALRSLMAYSVPFAHPDSLALPDLFDDEAKALDAGPVRGITRADVLFWARAPREVAQGSGKAGASSIGWKLSHSWF
jgi:hypothetical protein